MFKKLLTRAGAILGVVLILTLGLTGLALAHGTVDQSFETYNGSISLLIVAARGQSFVPTIDNLVAVDLPFSGSGSVRVSIHEGTPEGPELGAVTGEPILGWNHFDFGTPITLTPGNIYSIRVSVLNGTNPLWDWRQVNLGGDNYANGVAWECNPTCAPTAGGIFDHLFRTYGEVDTDGDGVNDDDDAFPTDPSRAVSCDPGSYGAFSCVPAPVGQYVPTAGQLEALHCEIGTYQPSLGQTSCLLADPGHFVNTIGSAVQNACPIGKYQPNEGSYTCYDAAPGTFVDTAGASTSTPCLAGTYQPNAGSISCNLADAGYFVPYSGAVAQTMCPDGYTSEAGAIECYRLNTAPTADAGGPYTGNEGSAIALSGASASDADGDTLTINWSVDSALCSFDDASALKPSLNCSDNGSFTATLEVSDGTETASSDASITVDNVAPSLSAISLDQSLVSVNTEINASAVFTDPGVLDTLTAAWDWGDGTIDDDSHSYSAPGVYTVKLTVSDNYPAVSNESVYQYVVVYDPSAGFVTGGGWINSPAGAYTADPSMTGKASFGFVAKYKKGANVPDGNTEFQFKAGDLNFQSSSYQWLVVAGNKAQFKGEGTINGQGSYQFMITANDDNPDTFRIKIWDDNGTVYDNGSEQPLGGGSIVVHSK